MPENPFEEARFDHVGETGELVFVSGAGKFAVKVDDALERAILEAKQIRSEVQREHQPHTSTTLPISQIQSLIRAGADPARVAERYALSEALVRRFSAAVETEKQYAIEQFLAVPAPKESRVRTLSELIERTFAAARVRFGGRDLEGYATRSGAMENHRAIHIQRPHHPCRMDMEHARQRRDLPQCNRQETHRRTGHA